MVLLETLLEILVKSGDLLEKSIVLPIIASAFLSVITSDISKNLGKINFFSTKYKNNITVLLDIGLHYLFAFIIACVILFVIYLFISAFIILFS